MRFLCCEMPGHSESVWSSEMRQNPCAVQVQHEGALEIDRSTMMLREILKCRTETHLLWSLVGFAVAVLFQSKHEAG